MYFKQIAPLERGVISPGGHLCLLAPAAPVKPLADVVCDYTRSDRHQKGYDVAHVLTSFLLPGGGM